MGKTPICVLDPSGDLARASETLRGEGASRYGTLEDLIEALTGLHGPCLVVTDARAGVVTPEEVHADTADSWPPLWLAVVRTEEEGLRWTEGPATESLVFPERAAVLEARVQSLLRLCDRVRPLSDTLQAECAFLRHTAHELKNPLNVIFGYTELLLLDHELPAPVRDDLAQVLRSANTLLEGCDALRQRSEDLVGSRATEECAV
jgi:signal transduction histidine kinase